jgi:hypothetical protein
MRRGVPSAILADVKAIGWECTKQPGQLRGAHVDNDIDVVRKPVLAVGGARVRSGDRVAQSKTLDGPRDVL